MIKIKLPLEKLKAYANDRTFASQKTKQNDKYNVKWKSRVRKGNDTVKMPKKEERHLNKIKK